MSASAHGLWHLSLAAPAVMLVLASMSTGEEEAGRAATRPATRPAAVQHPSLKIFSGQQRLIVVNGYSTSFHWPKVLQRKLDRHFNGKRIIEVRRASKGGSPIARWIDVKTGEPRPIWDRARTALQSKGDRPAIFLGQQSLQYAFGARKAGITGKGDTARIAQGAEIIRRYVSLARRDGADLVIVAMHIYKKPMEPEIGNERLALAALVRQGMEGFFPGPDVWTPTKGLYPQAFAKDRLHPNDTGAEVMAHYWFETLLKLDGLETPPWSRQEMAGAIGKARKAAGAGSTTTPAKEGPTTKRAPRARTSRRSTHFFKTIGDVALKADVYSPLAKGTKRPCVLFLHGGGLVAFYRGRVSARLNEEFTRRGYAVVSIDYRLAPGTKCEGIMEDVRDAYTWIREEGPKQFDIDPDNISVVGASAGGYLTLMSGFWLKPAPRALVSISGYGDILWYRHSDEPAPDYDVKEHKSYLRYCMKYGVWVQNVIGLDRVKDAEALQRFRPVANVTAKYPPVMEIHARQDSVPLAVARKMKAKLDEAGVENVLVEVPARGHALGLLKDHPQLDLEKKMVDFVSKHARK